MATEINALIEYSEANELDWNALVVPIPNRMIAMAADTFEFKIGNGVDTFANLSVAFDLDSRESIATKLSYFPELTIDDADKIVVVNGDGTTFTVSANKLSDLILSSTLATQASAYSSLIHTHTQYLEQDDVDTLIDDRMLDASSNIDNQETISWLVSEKVFEDAEIGANLPTGYVDEFTSNDYLDTVATTNMFIGDGTIKEEQYKTLSTNIEKKSWPGSCFYQGEFYVFGGRNTDTDNVPTNTAIKFNPLTKEITELASMPQALFGICAVLYQDKIYIFGGRYNLSADNSDSVYAYDPATDTYETLAVMPTAANSYSAVEYEGKIYLIGGSVSAGYSEAGCSAPAQVYDVATDTWSTIADELWNVYGPILVAHDGYIYMFGGANSTYNVYVDAARYNISTDTWETLADMPDIVYYGECAVISEKIYVFGYHHPTYINDTDNLNAVYIYDIQSNVWNIVQDSMSNEVVNAIANIGELYYIFHRTSVSVCDTKGLFAPSFTSLPITAAADIDEGNVMIRGINIQNMNKETFVELSRDGGNNWAKVTMTKSPLSPDDIEIYSGGNYFNTTLDDVNIDLTSADIQDHKGNVTTFTVDTEDTSGHVDSSITTDLIGAKIILENTNELIIKDVASSGTLTDNVVFEGTSTTGSYIVTSIVKSELDGTDLIATSFGTDVITDISKSNTSHAKSVAIGTKIYYIGELSYSYDTEDGSWVKLATIPEFNVGADVVTYGTKIYVVGGDSASLGMTLYAYDVAADTWTTLTKAGALRISYPGATIHDGKIYTFGGYNGSVTIDTVWMYDITTGMWTQMNNGPAPLQGGSLVSYGDYIYSIGGYNDGIWYGSVYRYNPVADSWVLRTTLSTVMTLAGTTVIAGKIYIFGGNTTGQTRLNTTIIYDITNNTYVLGENCPYAAANNSATVIDGDIFVTFSEGSTVRYNLTYKYDILADTFTREWTMPFAKARACGTLADDGHYYMVGGTELYAGSIPTIVWKYNPVLEIWEPLANAVGVYESAMVAIGTTLYLVGGRETDGDNETDTLISYDLITDTVDDTTLTPFPRTIYAHCMVAYNSKIYLFGGYSGSYQNALYEYDPSTDTWTQLTSGPSARTYASIVTYGDKLYLYGGHDGSDYLSDLWEYDVVSDTWTELTSGPVAMGGHQSVIIDDNVYILGGVNESGVLDGIYRYDITTTTWYERDTKLIQPMAFFNAVYHNYKITAFNGILDLSSNFNYDTYKYYVKQFSRGYSTTIIDLTNTDIRDILPTVPLVNKTYVAFKVTVDTATYYKAYVSGEWVDIVRNISGYWEYRTVLSTWNVPTQDTAGAALSKALIAAINQMFVSEITDTPIAEIDYSGIAVVNHADEEVYSLALATLSITDITLDAGTELIYRVTAPKGSNITIYGTRLNYK